MPRTQRTMSQMLHNRSSSQPMKISVVTAPIRKKSRPIQKVRIWKS